MEPFIAQICPFGFSFAPRGWANCAGQILPISTNTALFSLIGTTYGGDGRTSFGLPDLRGRASVNEGRFPGSSYDWRIGQVMGQEFHTLTELEMPNHSHQATFTPGPMDTEAGVQASTDAATTDGPAEGSYLARNDGGRNPGILMYRPDAGSGTVNLGGVSGGSGAGGSVSVHSTGGSQSFNLIQPTLAVNYSIALIGTFPSRS